MFNVFPVVSLAKQKKVVQMFNVNIFNVFQKMYFLSTEKQKRKFFHIGDHLEENMVIFYIQHTSKPEYFYRRIYDCSY